MTDRSQNSLPAQATRAKKEEMEITINKDGSVELHVNGVSGKNCIKMTKELEEALGVVLNREKTGEYYQEPVVENGYVNNESGENK